LRVFVRSLGFPNSVAPYELIDHQRSLTAAPDRGRIDEDLARPSFCGYLKKNRYQRTSFNGVSSLEKDAAVRGLSVSLLIDSMEIRNLLHILYIMSP
jgi:hypothetical protein